MEDKPNTMRVILNPILLFIVLCMGFSLSTCTYDKSVIYHKNYKVGSNISLHLRGYYFYNNEIVTAKGKERFFYPVFFYKDGSVIFMGAHKDTAQLKKIILESPSKVWGFWGNYKISNDTIQIETIGSYGSSFHHERHTKLGLVKNDSICIIREIDKTGKIKEVKENIYFTNFNIKPDSTLNWIRKKRKYNR